MELVIITPHEKNIYSVDWLEINTKQGNFIIQEGHAPMIIALEAGKEAIFSLGDKQNSIIISHGIAHITRDKITLLLNKKI